VLFWITLFDGFAEDDAPALAELKFVLTLFVPANAPNGNTNSKIRMLKKITFFISSLTFFTRFEHPVLLGFQTAVALCHLPFEGDSRPDSNIRHCLTVFIYFVPTGHAEELTVAEDEDVYPMVFPPTTIGADVDVPPTIVMPAASQFRYGAPAGLFTLKLNEP